MGLSILQFPDEILIEIISRVSNADLDSFTLACKRLRAVATGFIREHRRRQEVFRSITFGTPVWPIDERTTWIHPTLMLLDLLRDDLLCYPLVFNIDDHEVEGGRDDERELAYPDGYSDSDSGNGTDPSSEVDRAMESSTNELGPLIEASPLFTGDQELSRGVLEGDTSTTLGLLLNVLPNLRTLNVMGYREPSPGTGTLTRILDKLLTTNQNPPRGSTPSLAKLESVVFTRGNIWDYEYDKWNLSKYAPLFYFPSVRNIWATGLEDSHSEDSWTYPGLESHVKRLELGVSTINIENLRSYLKSTQNLLCFKFTEAPSWGIRPSGCQVVDVVQTVLEHAGHSLRHLNIQCEEYHVQLARAGGHFLGSLKAFCVLDIIQIRDSMLIEPVETREGIVANPATARSGRACRLIDILPPSVVRLCVTEYGTGDDLAAILRALPERKADLLPHLEVIAFCQYGCSVATAAQVELLNACSEAGITTLSLTDGSDDGKSKYGFGWMM